MRTLLAASLLALSTFVVGCAGEPDDAATSPDEEVASTASELRSGTSLADLLAKTKRDAVQRSFDAALASLRAPKAAGVEGLRQIDVALSAVQVVLAKGGLLDDGKAEKGARKEKSSAPEEKALEAPEKATRDDVDEITKDEVPGAKRSLVEKAEGKLEEAEKKMAEMQRGKTKSGDVAASVEALQAALRASLASACATAMDPKLADRQARINQALGNAIAEAIESTSEHATLVSPVAAVRGALALALGQGCSAEPGVAAIPRGARKP